MVKMVYSLVKDPIFQTLHSMNRGNIAAKVITKVISRAWSQFTDDQKKVWAELGKTQPSSNHPTHVAAVKAAKLMIMNEFTLFIADTETLEAIIPGNTYTYFVSSVIASKVM